jgi:histidinol-phosphate aminotransferase
MALAAAGVALPRGSSEGELAWRALGSLASPNAVRLNSNENPLGPSRPALDAMQKLGAEEGRYAFQADKALRLRIAELEGLRPEYVETFNGSSDPLHRSVLAFTGPDRAYVYGEPGFEAGWQAAKISGAPAIPVPLTPTIAHDARAMCAATPAPGLLFICNPNNPTGTITPREEIVWALANKPAGSILLVDEAYIHFSDEASVVDLVDSHGDLLVLRTFSKLYGMAGLRMGLAIAQPPVLEQLRAFGGTISSITGVTAARISVDDPSLVPVRRAYTKQAREETFAFLTKYGYGFYPSQSNCFMLDAKRPAGELATAMAQRNVLIGRTWPVWPNYARVTIGTPEEMRQFCAALREVMA